MFPYKSQGHFGPQRKPQAILPIRGNVPETSTSILAFWNFLGRCRNPQTGISKNYRVVIACVMGKDHCTVW
jgi:hypothetical protein